MFYRLGEMNDMQVARASQTAQVTQGKGRRGFTLLELLMVVAILGVVLIAITQLLTAVLSGSGKSSAAQAVKENGQFALSTIQKTVRRAKSVSVCSGGTLTVIVSEAGGDVTYSFSWTGSPTYGLTKTTTPSGNTSDLVDSSVRVTAFSCTLTSALPTAPAVVSISMTLDKPSLSVDQSAGSQTFTASSSLRTY